MARQDLIIPLPATLYRRGLPETVFWILRTLRYGVATRSPGGVTGVKLRPCRPVCGLILFPFRPYNMES